MKINQKEEHLIKLDNVSLDIPIFSFSDRTIKSLFLKKTQFNRKTSARIQKKRQFYVNALININFQISKGERYALIGSNGSGKTTLLKVLSGIYKPTYGKLLSSINVFPLIQKTFLTDEEITGYEATKAHFFLYCNQKIEFDEYLDDIVSFSGLEEFIYLPLNTYSTGMKTRLIFSLLTSFNYDCLAMDEGLGTGDNDFIEKANKRLGDFIFNSGNLILASHSEDLLKKFCNKGLVLKKGKIVFDGNLNEALDFYKCNYD